MRVKKKTKQSLSVKIEPPHLLIISFAEHGIINNIYMHVRVHVAMSAIVNISLCARVHKCLIEGFEYSVWAICMKLPNLS